MHEYSERNDPLIEPANTERLCAAVVVVQHGRTSQYGAELAAERSCAYSNMPYCWKPVLNNKKKRSEKSRL